MIYRPELIILSVARLDSSTSMKGYELGHKINHPFEGGMFKRVTRTVYTQISKMYNYSIKNNHHQKGYERSLEAHINPSGST